MRLARSDAEEFDHCLLRSAGTVPRAHLTPASDFRTHKPSRAASRVF